MEIPQELGVKEVGLARSSNNPTFSYLASCLGHTAQPGRRVPAPALPRAPGCSLPGHRAPAGTVPSACWCPWCGACPLTSLAGQHTAWGRAQASVFTAKPHAGLRVWAFQPCKWFRSLQVDFADASRIKQIPIPVSPWGKSPGSVGARIQSTPPSVPHHGKE